MESLGLVRAMVVRRVQDVSSESGQLPPDVPLLTVTDRISIRCGGEAYIYLARLMGQQVVSREHPAPEDGDWNSLDGKLILDVSSRRTP